MTSLRTRLAVVALLACSFAGLAPEGVLGQEALAQAKSLYASAEYDQALAILNRVENASQGVEFDQYRALCLLALGRPDDAGIVIQRIVEKSPTFEPADVSPRVQATFRDVRRRVLPTIVRQTYADAKTVYEGGDLDRAKGRFEAVIAQLDALDAMGVGDLKDLRVLSTGFLDLITRTSKANALAAAPPPAAVAKTIPKEPPPPPAAAVIHGPNEPGITPPVPIDQTMPPWRPNRQESQTYEAVLSYVIDEKGAVIEATVVGSLRPAYDAALRRATASWRFRPATKDGVPVKYRRTIAVRLTTEGQ
jgi:TonB family protein